MRSIAIAAAVPLALAACGEPVSAPDEAEPEVPPVVDEPADPAPPNVQLTEGMSWTYRESDNTALFGPTESEGVLSIRCTSGADGKRLTFARFDDIDSDQEGMLIFSTGGRSATVDVAPMETERPPRQYWQGSVPADDPVATLLDEARAPIEIGLEGGESIGVPAGDALRKVVGACR